MINFPESSPMVKIAEAQDEVLLGLLDLQEAILLGLKVPNLTDKDRDTLGELSSNTQEIIHYILLSMEVLKSSA